MFTQLCQREHYARTWRGSQDKPRVRTARAHFAQLPPTPRALFTHIPRIVCAFIEPRARSNPSLATPAVKFDFSTLDGAN